MSAYAVRKLLIWPNPKIAYLLLDVVIDYFAEKASILFFFRKLESLQTDFDRSLKIVILLISGDLTSILCKRLLNGTLNPAVIFSF